MNQLCGSVWGFEICFALVVAPGEESMLVRHGLELVLHLVLRTGPSFYFKVLSLTTIFLTK